MEDGTIVCFNLYLLYYKIGYISYILGIAQGLTKLIYLFVPQPEVIISVIPNPLAFTLFDDF